MKNKAGLTYAGAGVGVDIDAGNALVEKIKPLARATRRPGADAEIGGFGGIFDLKAAGFTDPILVAANDGDLPRGLPKNLVVEIDLSAIPVPEVFAWLAANGGVAEPEMLRTFNCSI